MPTETIIRTLKEAKQENPKHILPRTVLKAVADENGDYISSGVTAQDINQLHGKTLVTANAQTLTDAQKTQVISNIGHYDGLYEIKDITNTSITMGEVADFLDGVNAAGNKVAFNLAAFKSMMFLCTIYIDRVASFVRVADQVTGFEKKTFFKNSDKLADILNGISTQGKHYTIAWDKTNSQCTRLNDAQNITADRALISGLTFLRVIE